MATGAGQPLAPEELGRAVASIRAWQGGAPSVPCPRCATAGLVIVDRSARPHAEWYALSCAACGLDAAVHWAMGGARSGGDSET